MNACGKILQQLSEQGVALVIENGRLQARTKAAQLSESQLSLIRAHKEELFSYLSSAKATFYSKINRSEKSTAPLSYSQQGLWFLEQFATVRGEYNMCASFSLHGHLDIQIAESCFKEIIRRHQVLSYGIREVSGSIQQYSRDDSEFSIQRRRLNVHPDDDLHALLTAEIALFNRQHFDLNTDLMLKICFLSVECPLEQKTGQYLLANISHLAADGWSMDILLTEFVALYRAAVLSEPLVLAEPLLQYSDYAIWQREWLSQGHAAEQSLYWQTQLAGAPQLHSLPKKVKVNGVPASNIKIVRQFTTQDSTALLRLADHFQLTPFMLLHALLAVVLCRNSATREVVVGSSFANRHHTEVTGLIGLFANTIALRLNIDCSDWQTYFDHVRNTHLRAQANQDLPFELVVDSLPYSREVQQPVFQIMLVHDSDFGFSQKASADTFEIPGVSFNRLPEPELQARYDLNISLNLRAKQLNMDWVFDSNLFDKSFIDAMADQSIQLGTNLLSVMSSLIEGHPVKMSEVTLFSPEQFNALTKAGSFLSDFDDGAVLHQLFEAQVKRTPEKVCIRYADQAINYQELNDWASLLASHLCRFMLKPDDIVCICLNRGAEFVAAQLAVLKAGAAFVPVDPQLPEERIEYILNDTSAKVILTSQDLIGVLPVGDQLVIPVEREIHLKKSANLPVTNFQADVRSHNLAYVIYTSGSTGEPKAVLVEHRNIVNEVRCEVQDFGLSASSNVLHLISFSFDPSISHLYSALICGAEVSISETVEQASTLLARNKITHGYFPASVLAATELNSYPCLQFVSAGAEKCSYTVARKWAAGRRFFYCYGPTETTVCASWGPFKENGIAGMLGKPLKNTYVLILDEDKYPVPYGAPGELYIGGAGVARGYLNDAQKTAERFIADPFASRADLRLFKTGDLVRYSADGDLEYLGRLDNQIKLNGFRIELGEIEAVLQSYPVIQHCHLMLHSDEKQKTRLCAFYSVKQSHQQDAETTQQLSVFLSKKLPKYMIPSVFVRVEQWPLTRNGKTDISALVPPKYQNPESIISEPVTEQERLLRNILAELLGIAPESLSVTDNFFALGGDSILSIQLVSRAAKQGIFFNVNDVFTRQSVRDIAAVATEAIIDEQNNEASCGPAVLFPVARMHAADLTDLHYFNQAAVFELSTQYSESQLKLVLTALIQRHDVLRLYFTYEAGRLHGEYTTDELPIEDCICYKPAVTADECNVIEKLQRSFDLATAPLIRLVYLQSDSQPPQLLIIIHHFIIDGISWRVLLADLDMLLTQIRQQQPLSLAKTKMSYQQCGRLLQEFAQSSGLAAQRRYWSDVLQTDVTKICSSHAPLGTVATELQTTFRLNTQHTRSLISSCHRAYNTQGQELLLSALSVALQRWRGGNVFRIDLEGHGRDFFSGFGDVGETIGWFSVVYPILLRPEEHWSKTIAGVKQSVRSVPDKGVGFGVLQHFAAETGEKLTDNQSDGLLFNYLGQTATLEHSGQSIRLKDVVQHGTISPERRLTHSIVINCIVIRDELEFVFCTDSGAHSVADVNQFISIFTDTIGELIAHCLAQQGTVFSASDFPLSDLMEHEIVALQDQLAAEQQVLADVYPATPMQQGLLLHSELVANAYSSQLLLTFSESLDPERFRAAWQQVMANHEIFRTSFRPCEQGVLHQVVQSQGQLPWSYTDISEYGSDMQQQMLREFQLETREQPFDMSKAPLMRFALWKLSAQRYQLLWTHHHALLDGWCLPLIFDELSLYYADEKYQEKRPAAPKYRDYVRWQLAKGQLNARQFWQNELCILENKTTFSRQIENLTSARAEIRLNHTLEPELNESLRAFSKGQGITLNVLVQAAIGFVLQSYTGDRQVVFGATVSGRPVDLVDAEKTLGLFINTIPVVVSALPALTVSDWLHRQQNWLLNAMEHSDLPLIDILMQAPVQLNRDLFDLLLVFENYPIDTGLQEKLQQRGLVISELQAFEGTGYGLTVTVHAGAELHFELCANSACYSKKQLEDFMLHVSRVLRQFCQSGADGKVDGLELTDQHERALLLSGNQKRRKSYPHSRVLHSRFEQQVARTPHAIAVTHHDNQLTYHELNQRANRLAHRLRSCGVARQQLVGVFADRSADFLVAILAILKAGGSYLPFDSATPAGRLDYMLTDAQIALMLVDDSCHLRLSQVSDIIQIRLTDTNLAFSADNPDNINTPDDVAYMLYTSGSTGRPKGALVHHAGAVNHIDAEFDVLGFMDESFALRPATFLQSASCSSDVSVWQFLAPVLSGGATVIIDSMLDLAQMHRAIRRNHVTLMQAAPSVLKEYLNYLDALPPEARALPLQWMMSIAEAAPVRLINDWLAMYPGIPVMNGYGPTEASDDICEFIIRQPLPANYPSLPVGRPLPNISIYVLSCLGKLQPAGIVGEITVSGVCVGKGYWRNSEKTAAAFCPNPFAIDPETEQLLYRTGDLGYWNENGELMLVGRCDNQVKVRGHRVELGEVETLISDIHGVSEVVVLLQKSAGENVLVAFVVKQPNAELDSAKLFHHLSMVAPDHMLPAHIFWLTQMPRNSADKIDRHALAQSAVEMTFHHIESPSSDTERELLLIWQALLEKPAEQIGVSIPFFQLGGHSLLIIKMLAAIRAHFSVELTARDFFAAPTIAELAQHICLRQATDSSRAEEAIACEEWLL